MTDRLDNIGKLFVQRRLELGMTQAEIGEKIGVGRATISKIESGKGLTFDTINRMANALESEVTVELKPKSIIFQDKADYLMMAISEFAKTFNLTRKAAANYLVRFSGIDFIDSCYDAEHTLSMEDCVRDLATVCRRHGGTLA